MPEPLDMPSEWDDAVPAVEQWIRQAGSYLEVSEDLRPRVLEVARERRAKRRFARRAAWVLTALLALGSGLQSLSSHWQASPKGIVDQSICLSNVEVFSLAAAETSDSTEPPAAWNVAEVFAELRNRRAKLFESAL